MNTKWFLKSRPMGHIRGSNLRVKINGLAGQGDPTRMKPVSHGSIGRWRVGSGKDISNRTGRVNRLSKSRGSGLHPPTRPDQTREV